MLTDNEDVNVDILLQLPLNDLRKFCAANKYNRHFCLHNKRLQYKINQINLRVDHIMCDLKDIEIRTVKKLQYVEYIPKTIEYLNYIANIYDIKIDFRNIPYAFCKNNNVEYFDAMNNYGGYHIGFVIRNGCMVIWTGKITKNQLQKFLFHLLYDNVIVV